MVRKGKSYRKGRKKKRTRIVSFEKAEEKYNNNLILMGLEPWEKKYLRLIPWSYVEEGLHPRVHGRLNLLEPLKCEETLVRVDHYDVKAVLKIMGHNWPAGHKKPKDKKKESKNWGTKTLDELVVSVGREEDELVSWWRRPYCMENVRKHLKPSSNTQTNKPLFFETYDEEERLWGFAERVESTLFKASQKRKTILKKSRGARSASSRMSKKSARSQSKNKKTPVAPTKTKKPKGKSGKKKSVALQ